MQFTSRRGSVISNNRARALATAAALAFAVCSAAAHADTVLDFNLTPDATGISNGITSGTLQLTLSSAPDPSNSSETFSNQSAGIVDTSDVVINGSLAGDTYNLGPSAGCPDCGAAHVTAVFDDGALTSLSFGGGQPLRGTANTSNQLLTPSPLVIAAYYNTQFNQRSTFEGNLQIDVSAIPLPAALPLFAGGLGVMGLIGRRRKQKTLAAS